MMGYTNKELAGQLRDYVRLREMDSLSVMLRDAADALGPAPDPNTVEVRIHVRVDVQVDEFEITEVEYYAVGWGDNGVHAPDAKIACEGPTDSARYSVVTARVPKPSVAEVEGTVET